jgi:hypothetical protein
MTYVIVHLAATCCLYVVFKFMLMLMLMFMLMLMLMLMFMFLLMFIFLVQFRPTCVLIVSYIFKLTLVNI